MVVTNKDGSHIFLFPEVVEQSSIQYWSANFFSFMAFGGRTGSDIFELREWNMKKSESRNDALIEDSDTIAFFDIPIHLVFFYPIVLSHYRIFSARVRVKNKEVPDVTSF